MPAGNANQTMFVFTGNPETVNVSSLYKGGELGSVVRTTAGKQYQLVQVDSGVTASTGPGVVAATQVAFWKNKATYLVTNDLVQSGASSGGTGDRDLAAGIFMNAVTSGNFCFIQQRGRCNVLAASGGTWSDGVKAVANSGTAADAISVAAGTADTYRRIGVCRGTRASTTIPCDLDLPDVP